MEQIKLINLAATLINDASQAAGAKRPSDAQLHLVELRGLLNEQLELEAGGSQRNPADNSPEEKTEETSTE